MIFLAVVTYVLTGVLVGGIWIVMYREIYPEESLAALLCWL